MSHGDRHVGIRDLLAKVVAHQILEQNRRIVRHRLIHIPNRRKRLVLNLDPPHCLSRSIPVDRRNPSNYVTPVEHLVRSHHIVLRALHVQHFFASLHFNIRCDRKVLVRHNCENTR